MQVFTGLDSCGSPSALRLLRMARKAQRPPHPGRIAELHGLDRSLWDLCLRCWRTAGAEHITMSLIVAAMEVPREDILVCPAEWTLEELEAWTKAHVPNLGWINKFEEIQPTRDFDRGIVSIRALVRVGRRRIPANIRDFNALRRMQVRRRDVSANHCICLPD